MVEVDFQIYIKNTVLQTLSAKNGQRFFRNVNVGNEKRVAHHGATLSCCIYLCGSVLLHDYFGHGRTLAADINAGGGVVDTYAVEVVVFNGSVGIFAADVFDT